jgi:hypothetical protein
MEEIFIYTQWKYKPETEELPGQLEKCHKYQRVTPETHSQSTTVDIMEWDMCIFCFVRRRPHVVEMPVTHRNVLDETEARLNKIRSTHSALPAFGSEVFVSRKSADTGFRGLSKINGFLCGSKISTVAVRSFSWLIIQILHVFLHSCIKCLNSRM